MWRVRWNLGFSLVLGLVATLIGCGADVTDEGDFFNSTTLNDELHLSGRFCPDHGAEWQVKIMMIIDSSGSLQMLDENDHRVLATQELVKEYADKPNFLFDIIKFNSRVSVLTDGFVHLRGNEENVFGGQGLLEADSMTDYQGALGVAYQELLKDMENSSLAELLRTKYVLLFFSDGTPDPVCDGCVMDPPAHPRYSPDCDEDLHVVCTLMDNIVLDMEYAEPGMFSMLEGGSDYNHNYQIFQLVDSIMDLKDAFHVGELRLHTAFLYCRDQFGNATSPLCDAAEAAYNLDPDRGRALLREMARRGRGTFREFSSGNDIDFRDINYSPNQNGLRASLVLASNLNAIASSGIQLTDSDGDGLDDDTEMRIGTNPLDSDTDKDGYGDFFEYSMWSDFDPLDRQLPKTACIEKDDDDGDGLLGCEENYLGTDPELVDSDFDDLPDLVEFRNGTNPLENDTFMDLDFDGSNNLNEIMLHSNPSVSDELPISGYQYSIHPFWGDEGQQCLQFDISHIKLLTTGQRSAGQVGYNDILVWVKSAPTFSAVGSDRYRVACVRARYIAMEMKAPADGEIELTDENFVDPKDLDLGFENTNCVQAY